MKGVPAHLRELLRLCANPASAVALDEAAWHRVIRGARRGGVLAALHQRLDEAGVLQSLPTRALRHLQSGAAVARHRNQMLRNEWRLLDRALAPLQRQLVLMKGGAYAAQGLSFSAGRTPGDIDLMVAKEAIPRAEAALLTAGWSSEQRSEHDERYYREWSHEIPPLRRSVRAMEVDLHHALLPPEGRWRIDATQVMRRAVDLRTDGFVCRWQVLSPVDQVLHASIHLLQDTEHADRLRDIWDIDALLRSFDGAEFWVELVDTAQAHGIGRPLWYVLDCLRRCLDSPIPDSVAQRMRAWAPLAPVRWIMREALLLTLLPPNPDGPDRPALRRSAIAFLRTRAVFQRMPLRRLVVHLAQKARRKLMPRGALAGQSH